MNDLVLIRKNLFRRKLRAVLMIASILIAFTIFGVLASFEHAFNGQQRGAADRLVVTNKINLGQRLPLAYFNRVATIEGVRQVTHMSWFGGYYQEPKNAVVALAVEPESYLKLYESDFLVSPEARSAFIRERTGILVGERLMEKWGWKVGDHVPISSNIYSRGNSSHTWDFNIVGTLVGRTAGNGTNLLVMNYDYFNETRSFAKDEIGWLALSTAPSVGEEQVAKTIDQTFANSSYETSTDTEKSFTKAFSAQLGNVALVVELVVGAAFATILMIVGNTMVMTVRERIREVAVLKTLGFSGARILRLVLGELILLALLGGLPGLGIAFLLITSMRDSPVPLVPKLLLTPDIAATAVALMVTLGVLTGLVPALKAMRLRIVAALGRS